jgi:hypothetical protein
MEMQDGTQGPIYFYNNTLVNLFYGVRTANGGIWAGGSQGRNNIYWNIFSGDSNLPSNANDLLGDGSTGTPFLSYAGKNYHLAAGSAAIDAGATIGAPYNYDMDGNVRGAGDGYDIGAYEYGSGGDPVDPVISLSTSSITFAPMAEGAIATNTFTIINAGAGTLTGTVTETNTFLEIISGGSYSLTAGQSQVVTIRYTQSSAASSSGTIVCSGGGDGAVTVSGSLLAVLTGLTWTYDQATVSAPFVTNGGYISQPTGYSNNGQAGVAQGGRAIYTFDLETAGNYKVQANVTAESESQNSFWITIDTDAVDPANIWDVYPHTVGFETRVASWRGSGTFDANEYVPKVWGLAAGQHQLTIIGREADVRLGTVTLVPVSIPPGPQNVNMLRVRNLMLR